MRSGFSRSLREPPALPKGLLGKQQGPGFTQVGCRLLYTLYKQVVASDPGSSKSADDCRTTAQHLFCLLEACLMGCWASSRGQVFHR
jgi:hypothetical protein